MIHSMTGFGDAGRESEGVHYALELRSLNNRYFKATLRMPDELASLEPELETALRKRLTRGSITLIISIKATEAASAYHVDQSALRHYIEQATDAARGLADRLDGTVRIELGSLLALPGVVQPPQNTDLARRARPIALELLDEACEKLVAMRRREGQGLVDDLMTHRRFIADQLEAIAERAPTVVEEYHQRLRARVDHLLARAELKVHEVDLVREVAVYAERSDISEELQRLRAHLDQFEQMLHREDATPAGRSLDFVTQELLREANTIASKSNDAQISRTIVEVKGAIDRIKEQVQNIE